MVSTSATASPEAAQSTATRSSVLVHRITTIAGTSARVRCGSTRLMQT
ncbi:MAG: hypothetical protein HWQ35_29790 [Nostoc sp. NMS1]|nr:MULTISPECIES: hypothetical protein [unclassified Nostoc]MBN3910580.1 hypothetical protein [Nostoc sp. NMS1]MBN3991786.1 hypothetical protein [Nostoc sp. NMS2]